MHPACLPNTGPGAADARIVLCCLSLLAELSLALRDDFRIHVPDLLPKFVGLFVEAERSGHFDMVKPALQALEVRPVPTARSAALSWTKVWCVHDQMSRQNVLHHLIVFCRPYRLWAVQ